MSFAFISNPGIFFTKLSAITYYGAIYSVGGIVAGFLLDKYVIGTTEEKENAKSKWQLIGEIVGVTALLSIMAFIGRNLLQAIPFPFNGIQFGDITFDITRVKEYSSGAIFATFLVVFNKAIALKAAALKSKLMETDAERKKKEEESKKPKWM